MLTSVSRLFIGSAFRATAGPVLAPTWQALVRGARRGARLRQHVHAVDLGGFLVGSGGALLVLGLLQSFYGLLETSPSTGRLVLAVVFAAVALGVYAPHRVAARFEDRLWQQWPDFGPRWVRPLLGTDHDRPLHLVVLAGVGIITGALCVASLAMSLAAEWAYARFMERFLLGDATLWVIDSGLVAAVATPVAVALGATWSCLHHWAERPGGWILRPLAGGLMGVGLTLGITFSVMPEPRGEVLLMLASLPFFVLAMLSLRSPHNALASSGERMRPVPQKDSRWTGLVGLGLVLLMSSSVLAAVVWQRVFDVIGGGGTTALAVWFVGLSAGLIAGRMPLFRRMESLESIGLAFVWPGVATALGAGLVSAMGGALIQRLEAPVATLALAGAVVGVPALASGRALLRAFPVVLSSVGDRREGGGLLLGGLTLSACVVVVGAAPVLIATVGTYAGLAASSVICVAAGGALIIQSRDTSPRLRWMGLGAVLAAVALICLLLPSVGGGWLMSRPWKRVAFSESAWMTRSVWAVRGEIRRVADPAPADPLCDALAAELVEVESGFPADLARLPVGAKVALVGDVSAVPTNPATWDRLAFDPAASISLEPWPGRELAPCIEPALRYLRRTHRRYELILIHGGEIPRELRQGRAGARVLRAALSRLTAGGVLVLLAPMPDWSLSSLRELLRRRARGDAEFVWSATAIAGEPCIVLVFGRGEGWQERWTDWCAHQPRDGAELATILDAAWRPGGQPSSSWSEGLAAMLPQH